MRPMSINKREIYLAKIDISGDIPYYKAPIKLEVNYMFAKGDTDLTSYGIKDESFIVITTDMLTGQNFSRLDKVYVLNQIPALYDLLAEKADYQVKDVLIGINNCRIFLEKLQDGS